MPNVSRLPSAVLAPAVLGLAVLTACAGPGASGPATSTGAGSVAPSGTPASTPAGSGGSAGASAGASGGLVWLPEWAADDLPDAVATRRPLPFCGVEKAPVPQPMAFVDQAVRLCFWDAVQSGTEAEFVSIQTTMEGAPFAQIYRLAADGTVEVLTDFTQDPLGSGHWERMECGKVVEGEGEGLLGVADCAEATTLE